MIAANYNAQIGIALSSEMYNYSDYTYTMNAVDGRRGRHGKDQWSNHCPVCLDGSTMTRPMYLSLPLPSFQKNLLFSPSIPQHRSTVSSSKSLSPGTVLFNVIDFFPGLFRKMRLVQVPRPHSTTWFTSKYFDTWQLNQRNVQVSTISFQLLLKLD